MYSQPNNRLLGPILGLSPKSALLLLYIIGGLFGFSSCGTPTTAPSTAEPDPSQLSTWPEDRPCQLSDRFVELFQAERVKGEDKILFMDDMLQFPQDCLQNLLAQKTEKELILLTVYDLTRHTDLKVAEKAKDLARQFDAGYWIAEAIASDDPDRRAQIISFLLRIEPESMRDLLNTAELTQEGQSALQAELNAGTRRVLFPTGSADGERYHVQASWDPQSEEQVNCLSRLFHQSLLANRSVEEEKQILMARAESPARSSYWYSKQWALNMAQAIESCGAQSAFIALKPKPESPPASAEASDTEEEPPSEGQEPEND